MDWLSILIVGLCPRIGIIVLWPASGYVERISGSWLWPILGLIFLPWTTLMCVLAFAPAGNITAWGWLLVVLGLMLDLDTHRRSYTDRVRATIHRNGRWLIEPLSDWLSVL
jgi:hypothetical protein